MRTIVTLLALVLFIIDPGLLTFTAWLFACLFEYPRPRRADR